MSGAESRSACLKQLAEAAYDMARQRGQYQDKPSAAHLAHRIGAEAAGLRHAATGPPEAYAEALADVIIACLGVLEHCGVHADAAVCGRLGVHRIHAEETLGRYGMLIVRECDALREMLLRKNRSYGDSALEPVRIFSRCDTVEQIRVRIDDKLTRVARGTGEFDEDTILDLLGYLVLLRIARVLEQDRASGAKQSKEPSSD